MKITHQVNASPKRCNPSKSFVGAAILITTSVINQGTFVTNNGFNNFFDLFNPKPHNYN